MVVGMGRRIKSLILSYTVVSSDEVWNCSHEKVENHFCTRMALQEMASRIRYDLRSIYRIQLFNLSGCTEC